MKPEDIKALREKYKVTQEDFGRAFGVGAQSVYCWECGLRVLSVLSLSVLYRMEEALKDKAERKRIRDAVVAAKYVDPGFCISMVLYAAFGGGLKNGT